jgi:2,4-dienoyl-CoA reductase-like NADH-dependent reductase (Old Yellow Enzyme family)
MAEAVSAPVALLGGVDSVAAMDEAMAAGFEWVVMGRALLADPDFIPRLASGEAVVSRCTHCNECVAEMDRDGLRCVLDDEHPPLKLLDAEVHRHR